MTEPPSGFTKLNKIVLCLNGWVFQSVIILMIGLVNERDICLGGIKVNMTVYLFLWLLAFHLKYV